MSDDKTAAEARARIHLLQQASQVGHPLESHMKLRKGDTVKMVDADDPRSIPAYRSMRGEVVEASETAIRVRWFDPDGVDLGTDTMWRRPDTVALAQPHNESWR